MEKFRNGFTMVELSVVLVIVGIILGGIVKGLAMVENARFKRLKQDIAQIRTAVYAYYDRFGVFPGDDSSGRGVSDCEGVGNNDGVIDLVNLTQSKGEQKCFWLHLYATGIMSSTVSDLNNYSGASANINIAKKSPFGSPYLIWRLVGISINVPNVNIRMGDLFIMLQLPGDRAKKIDQQFDDGDATTGSIRVLVGQEYKANETPYVIFDF